MSDKRTILLQLDTDPHPSVFDRVVATDSDVDMLFSYGGVTPAQVPGLIHGAIFTRGSKDLHRTAVFIGGSDVAAGEALLAAVRKTLLPQYNLQVSVLLDSNGANTTAVAAVRAAAQHLNLPDTQALVLGGTGPVGQRVARLLAREGARVRIGSRQFDRAQGVADLIRQAVPTARVEPVATARSADAAPALADCQLVVAAGAAGVVVLPQAIRLQAGSLRVAIDLNAVPPVGIEGVGVSDKAQMRDGILAYGALGVGGLKMKIHRAAVRQLFTRNDQILDAEEVYALALNL
jgi:hypothetical protein